MDYEYIKGKRLCIVSLCKYKARKFSAFCIDHGEMTDINQLYKLYSVHEELTIDERQQLNVGSIRLNRIKCNLCGDVITSENRHDYKYCGCGSVAVDGGSWYLKRTGTDFTELSETYKEQEDESTSIFN